MCMTRKVEKTIYSPAGQVYMVSPVVVEGHALPAGHGVHWVLRPEEKEPGEQRTGSTSGVEHSYPGGHLVQVMALERL